MSSLRAVRNQLLISHNEGVISDEEFLLLYDLNKSTNLDFPYDWYDCFDFDDKPSLISQKKGKIA